MDKHEHLNLLRAYIAVTQNEAGYVFLMGKPDTDLVAIGWTQDPRVLIGNPPLISKVGGELIDCVPGPTLLAEILAIAFCFMPRHEEWMQDPDGKIAHQFRKAREHCIRGMHFGEYLHGLEDIAHDLADDVRLLKAFRRRLCRLI